MAAREEVQEHTDAVVPAPEPEATTPIPSDQAKFEACATALITHWEVVSEPVYTRKWQGVICPGGSSGPTRGIGWDDGTQTKLDIARVWSAHPQLERILPASGQTGDQRCRAYKATAQGIVTPFPYASTVFRTDSLPAYTNSARRAFGSAFDNATWPVQCGLVDLVYNRGGQTVGDRRAEYRTIAGQCLPAGDVACTAGQLRSMKRLWPGDAGVDKGLRARRDDEARTVLQPPT